MHGHLKTLGLLVVTTVAVAILVALLSGCGGNAPTLPSPDGGEEPGPSEGSLDVLVQRAIVGGADPVAGAQVSVYPTFGVSLGTAQVAPVATGTTGEDGHVIFHNLAPATYRVVAQDSGQEAEGLATVNAGQTAHITLTFPALVTTGNLHVCTRDDQENPVASHVVVTAITSGSQVGASATQAGWQADTGEDGCVLFEDLPPGDYEVTATAPGFSSPVSDTTHVTAGETANVILYFTYEYY